MMFTVAASRATHLEIPIRFEGKRWTGKMTGTSELQILKRCPAARPEFVKTSKVGTIFVPEKP
jgi:hypothetical protein